MVLHLAVSGTYGLVFALVWFIISRLGGFRPSNWMAGLVGTAYGALLWLLAQTVLLPGTGSALLTIPTWQFALAHLLYGLVLGVLAIRYSLGQPLAA
jgi:hypothetical protein